MLLAPSSFPLFHSAPPFHPSYPHHLMFDGSNLDGSHSPSPVPSSFSPTSSPSPHLLSPYPSSSSTSAHSLHPIYTPYNSPLSPSYPLPYLPTYPHHRHTPYIPHPHHHPHPSPHLSCPPPPRPQRNLHVDNLPPVSELTLRALFRPFGRILRVRVVLDKASGAHAGYGFVEYEREEEARRAMDEMEGQMVWSDERWRGEEGEDGEDGEEEEGGEGGREVEGAGGGEVVAVGVGVPVDATPGLPQPQVDEGGEGGAVSLPPISLHHPATLPPFHPPSSATLNSDGTYTLTSGILLSPQGQIGKRLRVTFARQKRRPTPPTPSPLPPPPPPVNTNLYIAGLPAHFTKSQLDHLFAPFSPHQPILESRILLDRRTGNSRGVGFVRFAEQGACQAAIMRWNGRVPPGAGSAITVRYATDKHVAAGVAAQQAQAKQRAGDGVGGGGGGEMGMGMGGGGEGAMGMGVGSGMGLGVGMSGGQQVGRGGQWYASEGARGGWEGEDGGGQGVGLGELQGGGALMQPHSPPSPLDLQAAMLQQMQLHSYYPFLPPLSPLSPPDSPSPFNHAHYGLHALHYSPPSPPVRLLPQMQMPSHSPAQAYHRQGSAGGIFQPRVVEVPQGEEAGRAEEGGQAQEQQEKADEEKQNVGVVNEGVQSEDSSNV